MIIGISGRKRSGKSTLGAALEKEFGFKQLAFADGVREFIAAAFGWDREDVFNERFKTELAFFDHYRATEVRGRELLQRIGTDAARKIFGDDCWVNVGMAKAVGQSGKGHAPHAFTAPIPDARGHFDTMKMVLAETECCAHELELPPPSGIMRRVDFCAVPKNIHTAGPEQHYVFTDVRFPNEVKAIRDVGGYVLRLNTLKSKDSCHEYVQANSAELEDGFCNFVMGSIPELREGGGVDCGLPRAAHPCAFPVDRHVSECSLPDLSNDAVTYNGVVTGTLEMNTHNALTMIKMWLGGAR